MPGYERELLEVIKQLPGSGRFKSLHRHQTYKGSIAIQDLHFTHGVVLDEILQLGLLVWSQLPKLQTTSSCYYHTERPAVVFKI